MQKFKNVGESVGINVGLNKTEKKIAALLIEDINYTLNDSFYETPVGVILESQPTQCGTSKA